MNPLKKIYLLEDRNMHLVKGKIDLNTGLLDGEFMEMLPHIKALVNVTGSFSFFETEVGTPSDVQSFQLEVSNFYGTIKVGVPDGFEILTPKGWSKVLVLSTVNGEVELTASVRLSGISAGNYGGNVAVSAGSSVKTLEVEGVVNEPFDERFITTWDIPEDDFLFTFPTAPYHGGVFDYWLDWGDGSPEEHFTDDTPPTHEYSEMGEYQIKATGSLPSVQIHKGLSNGVIFIGVYNFGDVKFRTFRHMFMNVYNNFYVPKKLTGHKLVESMYAMFYNCQNFNSDISEWDVSKITSMEDMFWNASSFNQNLNKWDVQNVIRFRRMFRNATAFNGNISSWNTGEGENMDLMFQGTVFNQDISNWNVSKVISMWSMFSHTTQFNQNISGWNVGNVTNMDSMFSNAQAFNQDLSGWCVENIANEPTSFATGATAWTLPKPNWGAPCKNKN